MVQIAENASIIGQACAATTETDVVIIGAGLAGSLAALVLARQGLGVAIIDRHATYPHEFRCEKFSGGQLALMRELGVLDCFAKVTQPYENVLVVRGGRPVGTQQRPECGLTYSDMVNTLREAWPLCVTFFEGRADAVVTSPDRQRVTLADGRVIQARLAIIATGLRDKLHDALGLRRKLIRRDQSFCIGFGLAAAGKKTFPFQAMTYFGEHAGDRIGYATFFPTGPGAVETAGAMRVNLFSYHSRHEPWAEGFRQDPIGRLHEVMPGLAPLLGDVRLVMPVEARPIDLYETENYLRDGIVLIGDAFRSSCPATGTGVTRILTDVRQLCLLHLPRWFASQGMDTGKITRFYEDAEKCACDDRSARAANRGRALATQTGLRQRAERGLILASGRANGFIETIRRRLNALRPRSASASDILRSRQPS